MMITFINSTWVKILMKCIRSEDTYTMLFLYQEDQLTLIQNWVIIIQNVSNLDYGGLMDIALLLVMQAKYI